MSDSLGLVQPCRTRMSRRRICNTTLLLLSSLSSSLALAAPEYDIRLSSALGSSGQNEIVLRLSDCRDVTGVTVDVQGISVDLSPLDANRVADASLACEFSVLASNSPVIDASVHVTLSDGTSITHAESYSAETIRPQVSLGGVGLQQTDEGQILVTDIQVTEDMDISYLDVSISALRASDVRANDGIVEGARNTAFAATDGTLRVWPGADSQETFNVSLPVTGELTDDEILRNGVVLVDVTAVDSSGNAGTFSTITFTGDDVSEDALALTVIPTEILFTDLLESAVLLPQVDFEFRGLTSVGGAGSGVTYTSSHPDIAAVSADGIVYPLRDSEGTEVTITLAFSDLPILSVPVTMDFSRTLTGIRTSDSGALSLTGLNQPHPLPEFYAEFDDGSEKLLTRASDVIVSVPDSAQPYLTLDDSRQFVATAAFDTAVSVEVTLTADQSVTGSFDITVSDAPPVVTTISRTQVVAGGDLQITGKAEDDTGIGRVEFYLDGTLTGTATQSPFELNLTVPEQWLNQQLEIHSIAYDLAGQATQSDPVKVQVRGETQVSVPAVDWVAPSSLQRVVENSQMFVQFERPLDDSGLSGISHIDLFLDDKRIGSINFPLIETRKVGGEELNFEIWRGNLNIPGISLAQVNYSLYAEVFANGGSERYPDQIVNVVKDQAPRVQMLSPQDGTTISVGAELLVRAQFSDDTADQGLEVSLLSNGEVIDSYYYTKEKGEVQQISSVDAVTDNHTFYFKPDAALLGRTVQLSLQVRDLNDQISESDIVAVQVRADLAPQVSLSFPTEGSQLIAGVPVELRAEATDDVAMKFVEFYVDGRLVGADSTRPYSFEYQSLKNIPEPQSLTLWAEAVDNQDQRSVSPRLSVTLGPDEQPPVINIVAPEVTETEAGEEHALVTEGTIIAFKVAGFDNVSVESLHLTGLKAENGLIVLTGDASDVLTDAQFPLQQIPGALNAWSALKIVTVPELAGLGGVDEYLMPVTATATDAAGNTSTAEITIVVSADTAPIVQLVTGHRETVMPLDSAGFDVVARDDVAVETLDVSIEVELSDGTSVTSEQSLTTENGLIPAPVVQQSIAFDLSALGSVAFGQTALVKVIAKDSSGQVSDEYTGEFIISSDLSKPDISIVSPLPNSTLYKGSQIAFDYKVQDDSYVESINFEIDGIPVHDATPRMRIFTGSFSRNISAEAEDEFSVTATAIDYAGKETTQIFNYKLASDTPPVLSIRSPASGTRLIVGEAFSANVLVSDNRGVDRVEFFTDKDSVRETLESIAVEEDHEDQERYVNASLRTPAVGHRLGVIAYDTEGLSTELFFELELLDDEEPPNIQLLEPLTALSLMPGDSFDIDGIADDNIHVASIETYLTDSSGEEIAVDWRFFAREDEQITISAPNPQTFGSVLVATRSNTEFKGDIEIPRELIDRAGEVFDFTVRAIDHGGNATDSPSVAITILADTEAPVITVLSPSDTLVANQPAKIDASISDNFGLATYRLDLITADAETVLLEPVAVANNIQQERIKQIDWDTSGFVVPAEGLSVTLRFTASDSSGNSTVENFIVTIEPDQPPVIAYQSQRPEELVPYGNSFSYVLRIEDDFVNSSEDTVFTLMTSQPAAPATPPVARLLQVDTLTVVPQIELQHNDIQGAAVRAIADELTIVNHDGNGLLTVQPFQIDSELQLAYAAAAGADFQDITDYRISYWYTDPCRVNGVDQITGAVDLSSDGPYGETARLMIEPLYAQNDVPAGAVSRIIIQRPELTQPVGQAINGLPGASSTAISSWYIRAADGSDFMLQPGNNTSAGGIGDTGDKFFYEQRRISGAQTYTVNNVGSEAATLYAYATDIASESRGPVQLTAVGSVSLSREYNAPEISLLNPSSGDPVRPLQHLKLDFSAVADAGVDSYQLLRDGVPVGGVFSGIPGTSSYSMHYQVPREFGSGVVNLGPLVKDSFGSSSIAEWELPLVANEAPAINLDEFASYKLPGTSDYNSIIDDQQRLDYAEFWLRTGETFRLKAGLSDDVGLALYQLNQLDANGARIKIYERSYTSQCPNAPPLSLQETVETVFAETRSTEYELLLTDTYGHTVTRQFIVHPLNNISPEIRFTSPANGQYIAAGTFQIGLKVAFTDDRQLAVNSSALRVYLNGRQLAVRAASTSDLDATAVTEQAYASMYDNIEATYSVALADQFGIIDAPFAGQANAVIEVPSGLYDANETVTLTAEITDSDGAVGRHSIQFNAAPDDILPEVVVTRPTAGFAAIENSDFTVSMRAYDNVKVTSLAMYSAYGSRNQSDEYVFSDYGEPLAVFDAIENADNNPITTLNIDTPEFQQLLHVPTLNEVRNLLSVDYDITGNPLDLWIKVVAIDASGNRRERALYYPIRADQRPTVDILSPVLNAQLVEGSKATVSVTAFDDVGVQQVRMVATRKGTNEELANLLLREAPYAFELTVPAFSDNPAENEIEITVDAIDGYGAIIGDPDLHRAVETTTVVIVPDQPPSIAIAAPENNSTLTEGEYLLVQVAAIDDVGFERVVLTVDGLAGRQRVFTDTEFPYEYILKIPYGQAGTDLLLSASATEHAFGGSGRTVTTTNSTTVQVLRDTVAPTVTISRPVTNAIVVEKRDLVFISQAEDDVAVSTVEANLFADRNSDGSFDADEQVFSRTLIKPPYSGSLPIGTIDEYLQTTASSTETVLLQLNIIATDGAGNSSSAVRTIELQRNTPPVIRGFTLLDSRGYSLSAGTTELTEGREIIVSVNAEDAEVGVDSVKLFQALGLAEDINQDSFQLISEDQAAPFAFQLTVPVDRVGQQIVFAAEATDVDGYESTRSDPLSLTIVSDSPPQAAIIKPVNDESVIVDGQSIEVIVEAFDDLGAEGIDRVVFYVNGVPVRTVYDNVTKQTGAAARENQYMADIRPPQGVPGLVVHAVVFDQVGNFTETSPVRVGRVADTVAPRLSLLQPAPGEILTRGEAVEMVVSIEDIGAADSRHVYAEWIREYQSDTGEWVSITNREIELFRHSAVDGEEQTYPENPDEHLYVYRAVLLDDDIISRDYLPNERIRVNTRVETRITTVL